MYNNNDSALYDRDMYVCCRRIVPIPMCSIQPETFRLSAGI